MTKQLSFQRYYVLDTYRFLAAFFVMIYHYDRWFELKLTSYSPLIDHFGHYVTFFFILSGFVIGVNYSDKINNFKSYFSFLKKRFARLYPLHLLTLLLIAGFGILAIRLGYDVRKPEYFDLRYIPQNLLMIHAWGTTPHRTFNGQSWSISAEWFLYIVFPALSYLCFKFRFSYIAIFLLLYIIFLQLFFLSIGQGYWAYATYNFSNFSAVPAFFIGIYMSTKIELFCKRYSYGFLPSYFFFILAIVFMHFYSVFEIILALFSLSILFAAAAEKNGHTSFLQSRWLVALGDASYGIYMLHYGVSFFLIALMMTFKIFAAPYTYAGFALSVFVSIGAALLSYRYFEMPARRWISNL